MGPLTRVVQTGIGLAAELKAASKERKASEVNMEDGSPDLVPIGQLHIQDASGVNDDNRDKSQDDEHFGGGASLTGTTSGMGQAEEDPPPPYAEEKLAEMGDIKYLEPTAQAMKASKLQCPVVIPQRRPGSKTRGFTRADAPVLSDYGIDQETFLAFLKSFHKASQASPILNVITIGAGALGTIPETLTILAGVGLSVLSGTAAELQRRHRTNTFLNEANELLFKPRGLYCLVMSFRPEAVPTDDLAVESVDTSKTALKWLGPPSSSFGTYTSNFRVSSGTTRSEVELPETAPLIYPDTGYTEVSKIKTVETQNGKANENVKRSAFSQYKKVAAAYFDKRAQAKYAYKYPDSALATETPPQFASKYGDPTHPSVIISYAGRASGAIKHESLAERQARKSAAAMQSSGLGGTVRRFLPPSVLYLLTVGLPSGTELAEVERAERDGDVRRG